MPYITGIDLARFIYINKMDTLVIFITGYSDFQYAKSGIDYQIFDYLLKPIDDKNALDSIKKAVSLMLERNKHKEMYNLFQNYFSAHFLDARKQYIEKLLFSPIKESKEELLEMQKQFSHSGRSIWAIWIDIFSQEVVFGKNLLYSYYRRIFK